MTGNREASPLFDDSRTVEDRVKEIMDKSNVFKDLTTIHGLPREEIEKVMISIVNQADEYKYYHNKYSAFLLDKFPHWS